MIFTIKDAPTWVQIPLGQVFALSLVGCRDEEWGGIEETSVRIQPVPDRSDVNV